MTKIRRPFLNPNHGRVLESALDAEKYLDRLALGTWRPNVDICETAEAVCVRVELPGVEKSDITLAIQDGVLRVQGMKREAVAPGGQHNCLCLERRYGRFDRAIPIHWVVEAQKARAVLEKGVLVIELPKLDDRRGRVVEIAITKKPG